MYKYISLFRKFNFAALEFPLTRSASRPTRFHLGRSQQRRLEVILWRFQVLTIHKVCERFPASPHYPFQQETSQGVVKQLRLRASEIIIMITDH